MHMTSPAWAAQADPVRPGAAGLLIGIECSRVRDSSWMYLTSLVTTRIGVELAAIQRKLPDYVIVGLQLYSARTFHVTLSPGYIRAGRDSLETSSTPKAIQTTTQDIEYYATRGLNLSKIFVFLAPSSSRAVDPYLQPYC